MKIRALVVDDEPLARERLRTLLKKEADFEVAGECGDGEKAVAAIEKLKPDLVFLDVQMPEADGFQVIEAVGAAAMPAVVFVTAYDKYALRAFEIHALDYLLKPFDRERFQKTLERARRHLADGGSTGDLHRRLLALLKSIQPVRGHVERLVLRSGGRVTFLRTDEIDWVGAAGNYVELHAGKEAHLLRETMSSIQARLDPERFIRIHRSTIVNVERVRQLRSSFHGDYEVLLRDGTRLTLTRNYKDKLQKLLGQEL